MLPKNVVLMKTKNNTFFTFLDKMQFYVWQLMTGFVQMGHIFKSTQVCVSLLALYFGKLEMLKIL